MIARRSSCSANSSLAQETIFYILWQMQLSTILRYVNTSICHSNDSEMMVPNSVYCRNCPIGQFRQWGQFERVDGWVCVTSYPQTVSFLLPLLKPSRRARSGRTHRKSFQYRSLCNSALRKYRRPFCQRSHADAIPLLDGVSDRGW